MSVRPADSPESVEPPEIQKNTILLAGLLTAIFVLLILVFYEYSRPREGNIIFPGGTTYLGDRSVSPTPVSSDTPKPLVLLTAPADAVWKTFTGKDNPFRFSYPETVTVASFPNAANETVVVRIGKTNPTEYPFLTVIDVTKGNYAAYRGKMKDMIANFASVSVGFSSVGLVEPFTNINGLKGYKTKLNKIDGQTEQDVFFELPGRTDRVLRLVNVVMDETLFSRIVDSVNWGVK